MCSVSSAADGDGDDERLIYRIAREALTNAVKHSGASAVIVRVSETSDALVLEVIDNGRGFDAAAALADPEEGHFGMQLMADQAAEAGARLRASAAPGDGVHWELRIPR